MKILMVCLGNICRSPMAEGVLQQKASDAGLNWQVESAGTSNIIGFPAHQFSKKVALLNGVNINNKTSRGFIAQDLDSYDRIYGMSTDVIAKIRAIAGKNFIENKVSLLMDELFPGENVEIPDPYYGTESDFHNVYKLIDAACNKIVAKYIAADK